MKFQRQRKHGAPNSVTPRVSSGVSSVLSSLLIPSVILNSPAPHTHCPHSYNLPSKTCFMIWSQQKFLDCFNISQLILLQRSQNKTWPGQSDKCRDLSVEKGDRHPEGSAKLVCHLLLRQWCPNFMSHLTPRKGLGDGRLPRTMTRVQGPRPYFPLPSEFLSGSSNSPLNVSLSYQVK